MICLALAAALALTTQVASPERQKELIAAIKAKSARQSAPIASQQIIGFEVAPAQFVGPPRPIFAAPAAVSAAPDPEPRADHSDPGRQSRKRAGYRAHNDKFAAEQAAARAEIERNLPLLMEMQRQENLNRMWQYEAELRFRSDMDFNDALRGVMRPNR